MSDEIFPDALASHQAALSSAAPQVVVKDAILAAIVTAFTAGAFSCTVSVGSYASNDLTYSMGLLNNLGYDASVSGSTLTVSW